MEDLRLAREALVIIFRIVFFFLVRFVRSQSTTPHTPAKILQPLNQNKAATYEIPIAIAATWRNSIESWQPVEFKGNWLQKRLAGPYFDTFSANRIAIGLQN